MWAKLLEIGRLFCFINIIKFANFKHDHILLDINSYLMEMFILERNQLC